jgi:hypothetical protein
MLDARKKLEDSRNFTEEQEEISSQKFLKDFLNLIPRGGKVLLKNRDLTVTIECLGRIYTFRAYIDNVPKFLGTTGTEMVPLINTTDDFEEKMQSLPELREFARFVENDNTQITFGEPK